MPLSDAALRNAKPRGTQYRLTDGDGLYVIVRPNGAKWWRFDYRRPGGSRNTLSFGTYPETGLSAARSQRERARELVAKGIDPSQERKAEAEQAEDRSFETVARQWWESRRPKWGEEYARRILNRLEKDVFPSLGKKRIEEITSSDLLAMLRKIEGRGVGETTYRVKNYVSEVFGFAIGHEWVSSDPTGPIDRGKLLKDKPAKERRAQIKVAELPQFMVRLAEANEEQDTLDALRLTLLTAVRTTEARFATFDEWERLDTDEPLWRIPPERMKMKNEHLVPAPRQAADIVRRRRDRMGGRGLVFARDTVSGTLSENTMLYGLYRMGYHSRATVHGLRGTFSTWANEQGWNRDWIERQLAHVEGNEVRLAYNAAEYLPGRRKLLQAWADFLDDQEEVGRLIG